ncbi:unannotated protein [freshwater metagenome]|uniref:Unannotated protein n=1 Tax=freshwater metagenome TaxID=449393 RepID=A0A6J7JUQ5_9ZZZZ|nr:hypothetical protein [Actinomycetota bacterium]
MTNENNEPATTGRELVTTNDRTVRTIVVNGREHRFADDRIGHDQLARLAFPTLAERESRSLVASFGGGPADHERGVVPFGGTVEIAQGQRFNVCVTDKS